MADGSSPVLAPIVLREYQTRAVENIRGKFRGGAKAVVAVGPCGSGKTILGSFAGKSHLERKGPESMVIVVAPRIELVDQWTETFRRIGLRVTEDLDTADQITIDGFTPQVIVTTIQAMLARKARPVATFVIVDECHHVLSGQWFTVIAPYLAMGARILGLTATPERADGTGLTGLFDALVEVATVQELVDLGHLVPCDVIAPECPPKRKGEGRSVVLAADPVDSYLEHGRDAAGNLRRAIFFCASIVQARDLKEALTARGVACASVDSKLKKDERKARIAAFRAAEIIALVNVDILTEGFDDPSVEVITLAKSFGHAGGYLQAVGRGERPSVATGKTRMLLIDLCGSYHAHGHPAEDRDYSLDGDPIKRRKKKPRKCPACGVVLKNADIRASKCRTCGESFGGGITVEVAPEPLQLVASEPSARSDKPLPFLINALRSARERGWLDNAAAHTFKRAFLRWPSASEKTRAARAINAEERAAAKIASAQP